MPSGGATALRSPALVPRAAAEPGLAAGEAPEPGGTEPRRRPPRTPTPREGGCTGQETVPSRLLKMSFPRLNSGGSRRGEYVFT